MGTILTPDPLRRRLLGAVPLLAASALLLPVPAALAADHRIEMRNIGADNRQFVFSPDLLFIQPGDQVRFVPVDQGHNSISVDGMVPPGGETWRGAIGQPVSATLTSEGVYGYRCVPHSAAGMVGLVVVGDARVNLSAARAVTHRGRAGQAFAALFDRLDAHLAEG
ncbi:MAG: pseudoazurin [Alphaproteobacteria bacterium]